MLPRGTMRSTSTLITETLDMMEEYSARCGMSKTTPVHCGNDGVGTAASSKLAPGSTL